MAVLDVIVPKLVPLPGVVAVVLGGSRARGTSRPDSDWDIGLYYRGGFDATLLRGLGFPGHVALPGEWGRIVNGGAWLSVEGEPVDVLLRDLDVVERWWAEAQSGRFEIDNVEGHIAGLPTYTPVGELAISQVLHGELPRVTYPDALRDAAGRRWRWTAPSRWRTPRSTRDAGTSPSPRARWRGRPLRRPMPCSPSAASGC
jgi:predicted nucleotidyltransferase